MPDQLVCQAPVVLETCARQRFISLLLWHQAEPGSDWERHRYAIPYDRQDHRNPVADHRTLANNLLPTRTEPLEPDS